MAENKIIDIIKTMLERKMLDPIKALTDSDYLNERVSMYIEAANIAREIIYRNTALNRLFSYVLRM